MNIRTSLLLGLILVLCVFGSAALVEDSAGG